MSAGSPHSDDHAHAALTNQHAWPSPPRYTLESTVLLHVEHDKWQHEMYSFSFFFFYSQFFLSVYLLNVSFFSAYLSISASISSVIVAKPTTPPIVLVPRESDSLEVAQTQVSREFHDNLSVNSAILVYAKLVLVI